MKRKLVPLSTIHVLVLQANEQLASRIPQSQKKTICQNIERLLFDVKLYSGFQYNYWLNQGAEKWENSGKFEGHKETYIIGPNAKDDDDFVSDIQGNFSRKYFIHKDLKEAGNI